jgi:hypothetical protein
VSDKQYGVVQDDGTVTEYATHSKAERAGRIEALVVRSGAKWVYRATGRTFTPEDVSGLSAATASAQAEEALKRARVRKYCGQVVSQLRTNDPEHVITRLHVQKSTCPPQVSHKIKQALETLPDLVNLDVEGTEPMYNYVFLTVVRRRYPPTSVG